MAYTLEVYFTGLCFIDLIGSRSANPDAMRVIMVNATGTHRPPVSGLGAPKYYHVPRLCVPARYLRSRGNQDPRPSHLFAGPDGIDCAVYDLRGKEIAVDSSDSLAFQVDSTFSWTVSLSTVEERVSGLKSVVRKPPSGNDGLVIAAATFDFGRLEMFELGSRGRTPLRFDFRRWDNGPRPGSTLTGQIADRLVLRAEGLQNPVDFGWAGESFSVGPDDEEEPRGVVPISLTNFDEQYNHSKIGGIYDFAWFYNLVEFNGSPPPESLIIPWAVPEINGGHTPSTGSCPPGTK